MAVLPQNRLDLIQFCEAHWPVWQAAPTTIGLTAAQVTAFKTNTETARSKFNAAESARMASRAATVTYYDVAGDLRDNAADLVRAIKFYAENQASPDVVYAAAQIPPPASPSPAPPPGKATDVRVELNPDGSLTFRWKATNASASSGAYFSIFRRIGEAMTPFTLAGNTGSRVFIDDTLPLGTTLATYIIQGFRGQAAGEQSDQLNVQFGVGGGGGFTVTMTPNTSGGGGQVMGMAA